VIYLREVNFDAIICNKHLKLMTIVAIL
jgi:hypothetical protein